MVLLSDLGFVSEKSDISTGNTAYHIPTGLVCVYDSLENDIKNKRIPMFTTEIVPAILENFSISKLDYMAENKNFRIR